MKMKMKHISLFEYYSDMPKQFSVQEIKNMTEDQFLMNLNELIGKGDDEQAFTMLQIFLNANPSSKNNWSFNDKLGYITKGNDFFSNKARQKVYYQDSLKRPNLQKEISDLEKEIRNYEEMIRMSKSRLEKLRSNIQIQFD